MDPPVMLGALPPSTVSARLRHNGLLLRVPPFVVRIGSDIQAVVEHLGSLYSAFPLASDDEFVDFDVEVRSVRGFRRWVRPQATFLLDGREPFKPLPLPQGAPLLEWGLNWSIANRPLELLIIHAAVLERGGHAVVMPGAPGSGKSTLCAALAAAAGWRLLSDELALIRIEDNAIVPIPRPVSLKGASIGLISNLAGPASIGRIYPDTRKGTLSHMKPPDSAVEAAGRPASCRWVVFPRYAAGSEPSAIAISRAEAFLRIADQSFNRESLGAAGFDTLCRVIGPSACWDIEYGNLDQAVQLIEETCRGSEP